MNLKISWFIITCLLDLCTINHALRQVADFKFDIRIILTKILNKMSETSSMSLPTTNSFRWSRLSFLKQKGDSTQKCFNVIISWLIAPAPCASDENDDGCQHLLQSSNDITLYHVAFKDEVGNSFIGHWAFCAPQSILRYCGIVFVFLF